MITHPEKILFPDCGVTKGELCAYYEAVAKLMLPHLRGRPITLERYPAGIHKKGFIQKDVAKGSPEWLNRVEVPKRASGESVHYALAYEARDLIWMANQNSITPHVWCSRVPQLEQPDCCVIDLDPSREDAQGLSRAALAVKAALTELGLSSFVKTSGSKGFHILVALAPGATFEDSWRFGHGVGRLLVKRHPDVFTQEFIKQDRAGRILVDTGRNGRGATFAAAYAVRARPLAPVSAPCTWQEVETGAAQPQSFTLRSLPERLATHGDLWGDITAHARALAEPLARLQALLTEEDWREAAAATTRRPRSRKAGRA